MEWHAVFKKCWPGRQQSPFWTEESKEYDVPSGQHLPSFGWTVSVVQKVLGAQHEVIPFLGSTSARVSHLFNAESYNVGYKRFDLQDCPSHTNRSFLPLPPILSVCDSSQIWEDRSGSRSRTICRESAHGVRSKVLRQRQVMLECKIMIVDLCFEYMTRFDFRPGKLLVIVRDS